MADIKTILNNAQNKMDQAIKHLENQLSKIRAGKANPHMLDNIFIDYYGVNTPLAQVANISTPDAKTIMIQPWEKDTIPAIEKAILQANLGVNPVNNGVLIRINIPPLTEERRKQTVKLVNAEGENSKVTIRNIRREINDELKNQKKNGVPEDEIKNAETEVQKITDNFIKKIDDILQKKEKELMTV